MSDIRRFFKSIPVLEGDILKSTACCDTEFARMGSAATKSEAVIRIEDENAFLERLEHRRASTGSSTKGDIDIKPTRRASSDGESNSADGENSTKKTTKKSKTLKAEIPTEEEINQFIESGRSYITLIKENYSLDNYRETQKVRQSLMRMKQLYFKFRSLPPSTAVKHRRDIGTFMVDQGLVPILAEIVVDISLSGWVTEDGKKDNQLFFCLYNSFILLFNFSDSTPAISEAAAEVPQFFEFIKEQLDMYSTMHTDPGSFDKHHETICRNFLGFTHNNSAVDSSRKRLHELDFMKTLIPFLESSVEKFKMSAVLSLANLVDEKDCEIIRSSIEAVKFLLKSFGKATKDSSHRCMGWSAKELAHGIGRLAANDSNKKMLVEEGAVPLLSRLACIGDLEEQAEAAGALWALSFDEDNKDHLIKEPGLVDKLVELSESADPSVKKQCQGVLWTLRYKLSENKDFKTIGQELISGRQERRAASAKSPKKKGKEKIETKIGHVMISYQWKNQSVLLRVRNFLKSNGYKTWMDVDYMGGSTLQAMAEAVENSAVVLLCMSPKYKDSPNCRAEAEYAFQRRVPIVPLLMERDYRPDGWLGILLGSKLFFDFSGKYLFEDTGSNLLKELGVKGLNTFDQVDSSEDPIKPSVDGGIVSAAPPTSKGTSGEVSMWGNYQVEKWLKKHEIINPKLSLLTGKHLLFLQNLRHEAPEAFYMLLRTDLQLTSLEDLMTFAYALRDLGL